ncbi:DUF5082 family protein [Sporosarcina sp. Marseille-Q4063]|nr:DUF5082 family protein [Sporosarcina sp. Marseille-Q4063]
MNQCNWQLASLNDRIESIKILQVKFIELKSDLLDFKSKLNEESRENHAYWKGRLLKEHNNIFKSSLIKGSLSTYINNVDRNLDDLNNELMRLQNEVYSTEGLIGNVKASLNWIATKIGNLVN